MKKITLSKTVYEGEMIPFWYAVTSVRWDLKGAVEVYIIPVNFIIRLWYAIVRKYGLSKFDQDIRDKMIERDAVGYSNGYEEGQRVVWAAIENCDKNIAKKLKELVEKKERKCQETSK